MVVKHSPSLRRRAALGMVGLGAPANDVAPVAPAGAPHGSGPTSSGALRSRDTVVDALRLALLPALLEAAPAHEHAPSLDVVLVDGARVDVDLAFGSASAAAGVGNVDAVADEAPALVAADRPADELAADAGWLVVDPDPFIA